jgi:hypothetical protein
LRSHKSSATKKIIEVIEESCAIVLGIFTVPMYKKVAEDVMTVRAQVVFSLLGTMDSILSSKLVPDIHNSSGTDAALSSPGTPLLPVQSTTTSARAGSSASPFHHDTPMATTPTLLEYGRSLSLPNFNDPGQLRSSTPSAHRTTTSDILSFDNTAGHSYDLPVNQTNTEVYSTEPHTMDVAAKREWLNRILYFIGFRLGVRKALEIPTAEGYMPIVGHHVHDILDRQQLGRSPRPGQAVGLKY